jgi:hypothetical protein
MTSALESCRRDLDEKAQQLQQEIEQGSKQSASKKPRHGGVSQDLANAVTKLASLADEKVTIAAQIYDFIDKHIQSLDEDLRALDSEIRADKERVGMGEDESAIEKLEATKSRGRGRVSAAAAAAAAAAEASEKKKRGRKRSETEEEDGEWVPAWACMEGDSTSVPPPSSFPLLFRP